MSWWQHGRELARMFQYQVFGVLLTSWVLSQHTDFLFFVLVYPLSTLACPFLLTELTEGWWILWYTISYSTFCLHLPFGFAQVTHFLQPGLYVAEYHWMRSFLRYGVVFGGSFLWVGYHFGLPWLGDTFLFDPLPSFQTLDPFHWEPQLKPYLFFLLNLGIGGFVSLCVFLLLRGSLQLQWLSSQTFVRLRFSFWFASFFWFACVTPPDLLSLLGCSLPWLGLYEYQLLSVLSWKRYQTSMARSHKGNVQDCKS